MTSRPSLFLAELKRRKVGRVAVAYAVVGVGVVEAADLFLTRLPVPAWTVDFIAILVLLGFPIALVLAWAVDITPQGIQRTSPLPPEQLEHHAPSRWTLGNWVFLGVGIIIVGVVAYFGFLRSRSTSLGNTRVAVLPFENLTGDSQLDPMGRMIAGWLSEGLVRTGLVDVVPTGVIVGAMDAGTATASDPLAALAEGTGAGILISGEVFSAGDSLQFQAQVTDAARRRILATVHARGPRAKPMDGLGLLRQRVMGAVAPHVDARITGYAEVFQAPPTFEAYEEFIEGMAAFFRMDFRASLAHSRRAYQMDTTLVSALLHVSQAYRNLGRTAQWDSILDLVNARRDRLSPPDRHLLDYNLAQRQGDLEGVYRSCRAWAESAPGYGQALYAHAWAALGINRPREAIDVLTRADPKSWGLRDWQSYWAVLTAAYHMVGDHQAELRAARAGQEQYPGSVSRVGDELRALAALGQVDRIREVLARATVVSQNNGAYGGLLQRVAEELRAHGHPEAAQAYFQESLAWYDGRPEQEKATVSYRTHLAGALSAARRWDRAFALYEGLNRESPATIEYMGHMGYLAARLGDRGEAEQVVRQLRQVGPNSPSSLIWQARIKAALGAREEAVRLLREAHAHGWMFSISLHADPHLQDLWDYPPFQQFIRPRG